jgi:hypothetical protein
MTDVSRGPGWWQASDLKWYPPEQHPNYEAPPPVPPPRPAEWPPSEIATAPPPLEQLSRQRPKWPLAVALIAAIVVILAAAGITFKLLQPHSPAPQTPTAQPALPSGQSAQPAPPSSAVVPSATAAPSAQVPGLAPFVGRWGGGHSGMIDIQSDGTGRWTYSDRSTCPNAPLSGCGITGTADFRLTSVANRTATGSVTAASNPNNDPLGEPVTIVLGTGWQGKGVVLAVSISKMQGWNFCNETSPHYCAES